MYGTYAWLDQDEKNILLKLATCEHRGPRAQAASPIRKSLERLGLLQPIIPPSPKKQGKAK